DRGADQERDRRGSERAHRLAELGVDRRLHGHQSSRARGQRDRHPRLHFAASQFSPDPTSTASGGSRSYAATISRTTISEAASTSDSGPSNRSSSWIWSPCRVSSPASSRALWEATLAHSLLTGPEPGI